MKRAGNLIEKIADIDNLRWAFLKTKKGKASSKNMQAFQRHLDANLLRLRQQILRADVDVGNNHFFTIYEPKERTICSCSFSEKVLHHAIMNVCHDIFENYQIHDSYASRIAKGSHAAIRQAQMFSKKNTWFLKMDVQKYFASMDGHVLKALLTKRFKDKALLQIFTAIIDTNTDAAGKGIPIGNLSSQYFANHYLAVADHFIKEQLKAKYYVRYMDDMVIWHQDKKVLKLWRREFSIFLEQTLRLTLKPALVNRCDKGLPFLGYRVFPNDLKLNRSSKKRFIKKHQRIQRDYTNHGATDKQCQLQSNSLFAFVQFANTYALRKNILFY